MKKILTVLVLGLMGQWGFSYEGKVRHIFVPAAYDDNDDILVYLDVELPSSCYSVKSIQATPDVESSSKILLNVAYNHEEGRICLPVVIYSFQQVKLPKLAAGKYTITAEQEKIVQKTFNIAEPSSEEKQDEFTYAPVENVFVEHRVDKKTGEIQYFAILQH